MARSGSDWDSTMTDAELLEVANSPGIDSKPESERRDLQEELCDRTGATWTSPDGLETYVPPQRR